MNKVKVYFLTPTDETGASSRYRVYQFLNYLEEIEYEVYPFLTEKIYKEFKNGNIFKLLIKVPLLILKRISLLFKIKKGSLLFVHRDIIPFGPMIFEKIFKLKKCKIILDLDDAVYCNEIEEIASKKNRILYKFKYGKRFDSAIKNADLIICGNRFIESHSKMFNKNTIIIPTVIDTEKIKVKKTSGIKNKMIIGWIGNPGNTKYIYEILKKIDKKRNVDLCFVLIGAKKFDTSIFKNIEINFFDWDKKTEYELLRKCDVGVMPLKDSEWSKGKCGLKLLQYMAVGIPGVGSDVGVNSDIIVEGKNGWIVKNDDWNEVIDKIIKNRNNLVKMSTFCREFIEKNYSINSYKGLYNKILKEESTK